MWGNTKGYEATCLSVYQNYAYVCIYIYIYTCVYMET